MVTDATRWAELTLRCPWGLQTNGTDVGKNTFTFADYQSKRIEHTFEK